MRELARREEDGEAMGTQQTVRLAALGDIHCGKTSQGAFQEMFHQITEAADVLAICGDLTDYGLPEEARVLAREITSGLRIPAIAVLGNHDYESGKQAEVTQILCDAGVHMLDGDAFEVGGVAFAGVRGFGGGFGRHALAAWGEETIKRFVHEALDEALKLESALARLRAPHRIAVLHYSPIRETVEGEPPEIFAFLGSSRLEEPLLRYPVNAVFHGHAHRGQARGKLRDGTPVYNVSLPVLRQTFPDQPPFHLMALAAPTEPAELQTNQPVR
jgi:Icc-related predicted phosphoesterase